jgi:phytoene dehydrogenase-like protein
MPVDTDHPVVVVGAGLAGLCCALELDRLDVPWILLDAADDVGGRVRTDRVQGFLLDRGFQVLLSAYPECRRLLDFDELRPQAFLPGAQVRVDNGFHRVGDPWRRPADALATLRAPVGSMVDKARIALLRARTAATPTHRLMDGDEATTGEHLAALGFSDRFVDVLLRPLFAGIQLDPELQTSRRAFDFVFAMLARGDNVLPAEGMQAIPRQLAARLDPARVRLGRRVRAVRDTTVELEGAQPLPASAVVIATGGPAAAALDPRVVDPGSRGVGCVYFASERPPVSEPVIVLDGERQGPVNNLAVLDRVASGYAPPGAHLVSAAVVEGWQLPDAKLVPAVRAQLRSWFGAAVDGWRHLRTDRIPHAQPDQTPPRLSPPQRPVRLAPGRYVCGDHRDDASINGAMVSGRRAAEAVVADLS